MEIKRIASHGIECFVLFTGPAYYLWNNYYGLLAYVERVGEYVPERATFHILYGNRHADYGQLGGHTTCDMLKRVIKREENKYIRKECTFTEAKQDLSNNILGIYNRIAK